MAKKSVRKSNPKVRTGKWFENTKLDPVSLPAEVHKRMEDENPDWDWVEFVVNGSEWLIVRQYDEEEEMSRVAAVVKARKDFF